MFEPLQLVVFVPPLYCLNHCWSISDSIVQAIIDVFVPYLTVFEPSLMQFSLLLMFFKPPLMILFSPLIRFEPVLMLFSPLLIVVSKILFCWCLIAPWSPLLLLSVYIIINCSNYFINSSFLVNNFFWPTVYKVYCKILMLVYVHVLLIMHY